MRQLDRSEIPELGRVQSVALPNADTFRLSNGLEVVFVRSRRVPLVGLDLVVRGGASTLEAHEAGLAALTADLLDEGAGELDAPGLAEAVEAIGGRLSTNAGYDAFRVRASVPSARLGTMVNLFADVALRPLFEPADVERVLALRQARALQRPDDPSNLADDAFSRVIYGEDAYGAPMLGSAETLATFDREGVTALYAAHFAPERATLFVVGDVQRETIEPLLEQAFGGWSAQAELRTLPLPLRSRPSRPGIHLVDKPGAAQSEIRVGRIGVSPSDPDIAAVHVLNTVLGGAFTSRLNSKLREEKGFTYGAFSSFTNNVRVGPFSAETAVHTPVTAEAIADILAEFERLRAEPVPEEELERAKRYLALRLPSRFETTSQILGAMTSLVLHSMPLEWFDGYVEQVMAVTPEDVLRVADTYLDTQGVVVVVAGDRETIEPLLRTLEWELIRIPGADQP